MREIKFRGKTLSGKWVYGYAAKFAHDSVPVILEDTEDGIEPRKIISDTVGQFTGLHDINGMEIYEGDIVAIASVIKGYVRYNARYWRYEIAAADEPLENERIPSGRPEECWMIIGNIHDNPEFLKTE
jgi:uncharacterized phage protein (TIGR01671 family)